MATNIGRLYATLALESAGFSKGLRKTETQLASTSRKIQGLSQGISRGIVGAFAGLAAGLGVRELINLSDAATSMSAKLKVATAGTGEFADVQARLRDVARETRAPIEDTVSLFQRLRIATNEIGSSTEEVIALVGGLNAAMVLSGGAATETGAAMRQLAQALAKGKLNGDELVSLLENTPDLLQRVQRELGLTQGEFLQLAKDQKITTDLLLPALQTATKGLVDELKGLPITFSQAFTTLRNSIVNAVGDFNVATGAAEGFAGAIVGIADVIDSVSSRLISFWSGQSGEADVLRGAMIALGDAISDTFDVPTLDDFARAFGDMVDEVADYGGILIDVIDSIQRTTIRMEIGALEWVLGDADVPDAQKELDALRQDLVGGTLRPQFDRLIAEARQRGRASRLAAEAEAAAAAAKTPPPAPTKKRGVGGESDADRRKREREEEKRRKAALREEEKRQTARLAISDRFLDVGLATATAKGQVEPFFAEMIDGRREVEELARTLKATDAEVKIYGDSFEAMFRQLTAEEGFAEAEDLVRGLQDDLANMDLTPAEQQARDVARAIDEIATASGATGPRLEELRAQAETALAGIEQKAKTVTVNVSGALAGSFSSTISGLLDGTASLESTLSDLSQNLVGAFTDAFAQILQDKLKSLDPELEQNFLKDIPGIVSEGAQSMGDGFMEFIDVAIGGVQDLIKWLIDAVQWQAILSAVSGIAGAFSGGAGAASSAGTVAGNIDAGVALADGGITKSHGLTRALLHANEAVIPLDRLASMVSAPRTDSQPPVVNIINNNGSQVSARQKSNTRDQYELEVMIDDTVSALVQRGSKTSRAVEGRFGLQRQPQVR